jgi:hypothetical protein
MLAVTLLVKVFSDFQLKHVDGFLKSSVRDLRVDVKVQGIAPQGWIQATISGEDERVALHYLADEIGLCPERFENVKKFETVKGRVTSKTGGRGELRVDIGVFNPKVIEASIPVHHLQAQLVDGRKMSVEGICRLFGLCDNLPLTVKIMEVNGGDNHIEAMISHQQLKIHKRWTDMFLDRLIVLGALPENVEFALRRAGFERDVVDVETLGLFECAVVCKLGTDAEGLIPRIGKSLRGSSFIVFSPRRIRDFLGGLS